MRGAMTFIAGIIAFGICITVLPGDLGWLVGLVAAVVVGMYTFRHFGNYREGAIETVKGTVDGARKTRDRVLSTVEEEEPTAFFGQAEEEADAGTYDKGLWSQALVKAGGDESKRKITYIQLRVAQLQRQRRKET